MKEVGGKRGACVAPPGEPLSPHLQPGSSANLVLWGFMEASLQTDG